MKKRTQSFLMILLGLVLAITACKKDDPAPVNPDPQQNRLTKVSNNFQSTELKYNPNGSMQSITMKDQNGTSILTYVFNYVADKISTVQSGAFKYKYTYTGNLVTNVEMYNALQDRVRMWEYSYTGNRLMLITEHGKGQPGEKKPYSRTAYTYNAAGNITRVVVHDYINNAWVYTGENILSAYDDKPNTSWPLEVYPYVPLLETNKNNPGKVELTDELANVVQTTLHTYTYDAKGRPLTRKTTIKTPGLPDDIIDTQYAY